ncbi:cilia- and flagella-associated protein 298-A-like [Sycon ciliatum]|uniref:cilia- and flagella-associated protein 298-A-like n=1 Tax=Sycon ciliatum TaxID=27933 RepID=UPI0020A899E0|eukprot:scpid60860/ scgid9718/ Uncharacterized protein C21orf59 homolog
MVKLHIKRGDESLFLYDTSTRIAMEELLHELVALSNAREQVLRLSEEILDLAKHGVAMAPNMQGLTEEQIAELKLEDEWAARCQPSGGSRLNPDPQGRRSGQAPSDKLSSVLTRTAEEAKEKVSKKQAAANICLTMEEVTQCLDQLRGSTMIVYPMGLPPHEPIRMELEQKIEEAVAGKQASKLILEESTAQLWWAGKEMMRGKKLHDYVGKNEKTKIIAKLQRKGQGAPGREPVVSEQEQKHMMAYAYRRQEELKKLEEAKDDSYMSSDWADPNSLKRAFQGVSNVSWKPR